MTENVVTEYVTEAEEERPVPMYNWADIYPDRKSLAEAARRYGGMLTKFAEHCKVDAHVAHAVRKGRSANWRAVVALRRGLADTFVDPWPPSIPRELRCTGCGQLHSLEDFTPFKDGKLFGLAPVADRCAARTAVATVNAHDVTYTDPPVPRRAPSGLLYQLELRSNSAGKTCRACGEFKSWDEYYKAEGYHNPFDQGHRPKCKRCWSDRTYMPTRWDATGKLYADYEFSPMGLGGNAPAPQPEEYEEVGKEVTVDVPITTTKVVSYKDEPYINPLPKKCSRCGKVLARKPETFWRDRSQPDGLRHMCVDCDKARRSKNGPITRYKVQEEVRQVEQPQPAIVEPTAAPEPRRAFDLPLEVSESVLTMLGTVQGHIRKLTEEAQEWERLAGEQDAELSQLRGRVVELEARLVERGAQLAMLDGLSPEKLEAVLHFARVFTER